MAEFRIEEVSNGWILEVDDEQSVFEIGPDDDPVAVFTDLMKEIYEQFAPESDEWRLEFKLIDLARPSPKIVK